MSKDFSPHLACLAALPRGLEYESKTSNLDRLQDNRKRLAAETEWIPSGMSVPYLPPAKYLSPWREWVLTT